MLRSGTLRVSARLGNISLEDLSDTKIGDPAFKKLLSIEGEELADISYETFDPNDSETFPGYNSSIQLRAGSLRFTFMEGPVRDLYAFALKFARMKAVYDAAQQAAVQRASEVTRMHYDIAVKTPIIVLPRDGLNSPDIVTLRLGEIQAKNEYLHDPNDTSTIKASLQGINVATTFTVENKPVTLTMVDDVGVSATIKQAGSETHRSDPHHADTEITTEMSDVNLALTQKQYMLLMGLVDTLPKSLSNLNQVGDSPESEIKTPATISALETPLTESPPPEIGADLQPELSLSKVNENGQQVRTTLDFVFSVNTIALQIYNVDATEQETLDQHGIARFALNKTHLGFKQLSDGAMEAEFSLKTISFASTRSGNSVFRDIVPSATHNGNQV